MLKLVKRVGMKREKLHQLTVVRENTRAYRKALLNVLRYALFCFFVTQIEYK